MRTALVVLLCAIAEPKPVLVHKSDSSFVHALRTGGDGTLLERVVEPGCMLLHTVRTSGEMTVLVPPTGTLAINTRRISYVTTRILGIAADAERLYVLFWSGHAFDKPPGPADGRFELRTFWLADGAALRAQILKAEGLQNEIPAETLEKGPLRLVEGGVEAYGTRATFKERQAAE